MTALNDQDDILAEYTAHGSVFVSCIVRSIFFKIKEQGCVDVEFNSDERCVFEDT